MKFYSSTDAKASESGDRLTSSLMIYFGSTLSQQTHEVLLYKFGDIVGTVGGSLGLFLGFSCLQAGKSLIQLIFNKFSTAT